MSHCLYMFSPLSLCALRQSRSFWSVESRTPFANLSSCYTHRNTHNLLPQVSLTLRLLRPSRPRPPLHPLPQHVPRPLHPPPIPPFLNNIKPAHGPPPPPLPPLLYPGDVPLEIRHQRRGPTRDGAEVREEHGADARPADDADGSHVQVGGVGGRAAHEALQGGAAAAADVGGQAQVDGGDEGGGEGGYEDQGDDAAGGDWGLSVSFLRVVFVLPPGGDIMGRGRREGG